MKKLIKIVSIILIFSLLSGCGKETQSGAKEENNAQKGNTSSAAKSSLQSSSKILIAYFSRAGENYNVGVVDKGNTQIVAEMIAKKTDGTLFRIETAEDYPESYSRCEDVAKKEQSDNARPKLKADVENFDEYDTVYIGYPIWWGDMPMAVYSFIESHDFSGKKILPFCTNEGSGLANTVESIKKECPKAEVLQGLSIRGQTAQKSEKDAEEAVDKWLEK